MKCNLFLLSRRGLLSFIGIWLLYFINSICAQAPCYYPTGKLQTADTACSPGELNSMCCNRNDICLSNGLCFTTQSNILSRGVCWPPCSRCTDQAWRSESCTTVCRNESMYCAHSDPTGGNPIYLCPNSAPSKWYCAGGSNVDRCTSNIPNSTFSLPQGFFSDFRDYRCIATTSNPNSCSIQSLTPPKSTPTTTISTANGPSPTPSLLQACQTSTSSQVGIGAGIGIPLLVALVASLFCLFRERRLRKQLAIDHGVSKEKGSFPSSSNFHSTWFSTKRKVPTLPVFEVEAGTVPTTTPVEMATISQGRRPELSN